MSYNDDKRELLKLKQGIIEESELIPVDQGEAADKAHYEVKGFKNKAANFWYHYKWILIFGCFFTAVVLFLVISTVTRKKGDIRILSFSSDAKIAQTLTYKVNDFENAFTLYTDNFDNNKYTKVDVYNINLNDKQDYNYYYTAQTKLYSEVSLGVAQIFVADRNVLKSILGSQTPDEAFEDLSALYPDNPNIVDKFYYKIKDTPFSKAANFLETCPDDLYIVIRKGGFDGMMGYTDEMAEHHRRAMLVFDNIINDKKINAAATTEK